MMMKDISQARNPDLRASVAAMQRAADLARHIAIQTNTHLVIVENGKIVRIPAEALREAASKENKHDVFLQEPGLLPLLPGGAEE